MKCPSPEDLIRFVDGGLTVEHRDAVEEHLDSCKACQGPVADLEDLAGVVARRSSFYKNDERRAQIHARIRNAPQRPARPPAWFFRLSWAFGGASVAALIAVVVVVLSDSSTGGFVARGSSQRTDKWVGIRVFRLAPGHDTPEEVEGTIQQNDHLLFSYANLDPDGVSWLSIVARDAAGKVHWYHPPRPDGEGEPASMRIESKTTGEEIPEAVRMPLAIGPMIIHAVFSREPLRSTSLERWVNAASQTTALPGTVVHSVEVVVVQSNNEDMP